MRCAVILSGVAVAFGTNIRTQDSISHQRFPLDIDAPLPGDLRLLAHPEKDARSLRGLPPKFQIPRLSPADLETLRAPPPSVAFPLADGVAIPLRAIPLDLPMDNDAFAPRSLAVDGPLQDLLNFGTAFGAAVFPGNVHDGPLELPMGALHVKMQQEVPKPLAVHDTPRQLRISGTLPKNLTAKTLKVFSHDRTLIVKYFLSQGKQAGNIVGIDEHFRLDFEPTAKPSVHYAAATGAFELVLPRPPKAESQNEVNIEFDNTQAVAPKAVVSSKKPPVAEHTSKKIVKLAANDAHDGAVVPAKVGKVALKRSEKAKPSRLSYAGDVPAREVLHKATVARRPASKAFTSDSDGLIKVTKQLREAVQNPAASYNADRASRAKEIANRARQVVADARLGDAKKELQNAFAPQIFEGEGLVLLELNH